MDRQGWFLACHSTLKDILMVDVHEDHLSPRGDSKPCSCLLGRSKMDGKRFIQNLRAECALQAKRLRSSRVPRLSRDLGMGMCSDPKPQTPAPIHKPKDGKHSTLATAVMLKSSSPASTFPHGFSMLFRLLEGWTGSKSIISCTRSLVTWPTDCLRH